MSVIDFKQVDYVHIVCRYVDLRQYIDGYLHRLRIHRGE